MVWAIGRVFTLSAFRVGHFDGHASSTEHSMRRVQTEIRAHPSIHPFFERLAPRGGQAQGTGLKHYAVPSLLEVGPPPPPVLRIGGSSEMGYLSFQPPLVEQLRRFLVLTK